MDGNPSVTNLVKVNDLWFDDGNLILQAEQTLFRIYRGLLCARSTVFADMFAFPAPAEGNRTMDGCLIIHTYDSAQDMSYFLRALLKSDFFEPPPSHTLMPIVEGVLRLSTKYDVHYLRLRAMEHLLSTYPTTLEAWRARDAHRTIPSVDNTPFVVLNLAREFDMPWLIPSVAYCISSHDIDKTLDGAGWSPSTTSTADDANGLVKLGWGDQKMCIKGRNNLIVKQNALALSLAKGPASSPPTIQPPPQVATTATPTPPLNGAQQPPNNIVPVHFHTPTGVVIDTDSDPTPYSDSQTCPFPSQCTFTRFRCAEILTLWGTAGLIDFYDEQRHAFAPGFCGACLEGFKRDWGRVSVEMWEALPGMFGLEGGWEELERIRVLSMQ